MPDRQQLTAEHEAHAQALDAIGLPMMGDAHRSQAAQLAAGAEMVCPECGGEGRFEKLSGRSHRCEVCGGTGEVLGL